VKPNKPFVLQGTVVEIMQEDVPLLLESIERAADELELEDQQTAWEDNFSLEKQRNRNRGSRES
jgi:hypothetical protein